MPLAQPASSRFATTGQTSNGLRMLAILAPDRGGDQFARGGARASMAPCVVIVTTSPQSPSRPARVASRIGLVFLDFSSRWIEPFLTALLLFRSCRFNRLQLPRLPWCVSQRCLNLHYLAAADNQQRPSVPRPITFQAIAPALGEHSKTIPSDDFVIDVDARAKRGAVANHPCHQ